MNPKELRGTLHDNADEAPRGTGLLAAVYARSRRRRRRHAAAGVAGVAVITAVSLVLSGPLVRWTTREAASPVEPAQSPQPAQPTQSSQTLVPPAYEVPSFPLTPGWVPAGFTGPYYRLTPEFTELVHLREGDPIGFHHVDPRLSVAVHPTDPGDGFAELINGEYAEEAVTVRGVDATLYTGRSDDDVADNRVAVVSWSDQPDRWVSVVGFNGFDGTDVLRYAAELVEQPLPGDAPFTFDLLPPDLQLRSTGFDNMSFTPAGEGRSARPVGILSATLFRGGLGFDQIVCSNDPGSGEIEMCPTTGRQPVRVGERDGELVTDEILIVVLDDGLGLIVRAAGALALSREDLIRLATGVHATPFARPPE